MKSNATMRRLLKDVTLVPTLQPALNVIVERGFTIREECYFLAALLHANTNVTRASFPDCTGYECFVNSVHVEDYEENLPLCQAIQFVRHVFAAWNAANQTITLVAIVSADELSVVVKFHVNRQPELWLSKNIEGFEDAVISIESSEDFTAALAELRAVR